MPAIMEEVEKALMSLIQDEGLTTERLARYGKWVFNAVGSGEVEPVREVILTALDDMDADDNVRALRNAFGVDYEGLTNLSERRAALLADETFQTVSEATLRRWERKAMQGLTHRLVLDHKYHLGAPYSAKRGWKLGQPFNPDDPWDNKQERECAGMASSAEEPEQSAILRKLDEQATLLREIRDALRERGQGSPSDGSQGL